MPLASCSKPKPAKDLEAVLLASLGLYPDVQTWSIVGLLLLWLCYAAYGLPYLLLGLNMKELLFSLIRVVAMFVVAAPLLDWIDARR